MGRREEGRAAGYRSRLDVDGWVDFIRLGKGGALGGEALMVMGNYAQQAAARLADDIAADYERRKAERAAREAARPGHTAEHRRIRDEMSRAAAKRIYGHIAETAPVYEPDHVDIAEMRTAHMVNLEAITDFCRAYRLARENPEALKAALNHGFCATGMPLKVINWKQWGHQ